MKKKNAPFYVNVSSRSGAPMGRRSDEIPVGTKVHLQRVPFVDGCYDPGGAYWGAPADLWCAWTNVKTVTLAVYVRAETRDAAKQKLPGLRFFR